MQGGAPGSLAHVRFTAGGGETSELPIAGQYRLEAGDVLSVEGSGAGGMGSPFSRPPEQVAVDVRRGYVSLDAARNSYGVVFDDAGAVDLVGTQALRAAHSEGGDKPT